MQLLQPKIEALRKELKDNPQKLNKEIMELYKEHKNLYENFWLKRFDMQTLPQNIIEGIFCR
jgi:hypothetical protein